ncbi:MAG: type II secretion system protein GspG [Candidatus Eremiobacteraeota bacterium]|nr:type II secretion system protein GspG [Candidatus Eremiobacteraeota bacterium]
MKRTRTIMILLSIALMLIFFMNCTQKKEPSVEDDRPKIPAVSSPIVDLTQTTTGKLPYYEVKILGNSNLLAGSVGGLRIITYNPKTQNPIENVPVSIFLSEEKQAKRKIVFSGKTGKNGSLDASFRIPADKEGTCKLAVVTGTKDKHISINTNINIKKSFKIHITVDKPMYQPGQKINIRVLALNIPDLKPLSEKDVTIEILDSKGNKVYKNAGKTSRFGVASGIFELADEVNMGTYKVKAIIDKETASRAVVVKKYVLPKFKVVFKKDRKFYSPGETLKGEIQADYFFGKPVSGGKVNARLNIFDVATRTVATAKGVTDKNGDFKFEMKIPDTITGTPLEKGQASVLMEVAVRDTAGHKERTYRSIPISNNPLKVELFPESGKLKPGIENRVYVLASYPDGSPVAATVNLEISNEKYNVVTDKAGVGIFKIKPSLQHSIIPRRVMNLQKKTLSEEPPSSRKVRVGIPRPGRAPSRPLGIPVRIDAYTPDGQRLKTTIYLPTTYKKDNIILRAEKAVYKVGESLKFDILSTQGQGSCYIDFIKNNQIISTHAVMLSGSVQAFSIEATPDMAGMVTAHAYRLTDNNNFIRDTKNIFIKNADDLAITTTLDKKQYKPGENAKIKLNVKGKNGKPLAAALGVDIVDEAVFAMGQMRPGLEKAYFLLQKQFMDPKYEIRGMTARDIVLADDKASRDKNIIEEIVLAKLPSPEKFTINLDSQTENLKECVQKMQKIQNALYEHYRKHRFYPSSYNFNVLVKEKFIKKEGMLDPWGNKFYLKEPKGKNMPPQIFTMGPDGKKDTKDDMDFTRIGQAFGKLRPQGRPALLRSEMRTISGAAPDSMDYAKFKVTKRLKVDAMKERKGESPKKKAGAPVRIREYFPETLYTNPQVITDDKGNAEIEVKMADSITSWRLSAFANSLKGQMGNITTAIKVFQDFFIDIDFPVSLTQNDEVDVPIAVYNYLKEKQTVKLTVDTSEKWFKLMDKPIKTITMNPGDVKAVHFRIKVTQIGNYTFTVHGKGSKLSDAIRRRIDVLPNGRMFIKSKSGSVEQEETVYMEIPDKSIPGASKILVRLYPVILTQVVEGLDKIFRMPHGCFEQTTAATYPNVLVLEYMKKTKKITPELQMKAESYINTGYQRLLSFEVQGGGFSMYGKSPANVNLTAMGIMEFRDMSKVWDVDENVTSRSQNWLMSQQKPDGSWGNMRSTAYIAWALTESGYKGGGLNKAIDYLKGQAGQIEDPYLLALLGNILTKIQPGNPMTQKVLQRLKDKATIDNDMAYWGTKKPTVMRSYGNVANIECTALATMALLKSPGDAGIASKAVNYLIKAKDPHGTWYSTQSTMLAMKALIMAQERATEKIDAKVKITVNGKQTEEFRINSNNYDVYNQADFGKVTKKGKNDVKISITGKGICYYQVVGKYYMPWVKVDRAKEPLTITIKYDRTKLQEDETITATVFVRNNTTKVMNNVMIDLGIPPGFDLVRSDLDQYVNKVFAKYTTTSRQILVYTDDVKEGETLKFKYRLRARFPMKIKTPDSNAYLYYNPDVKAVAEPVKLEVE